MNIDEEQDPKKKKGKKSLVATRQTSLLAVRSRPTFRHDEVDILSLSETFFDKKGSLFFSLPKSATILITRWP